MTLVVQVIFIHGLLHTLINHIFIIIDLYFHFHCYFHFFKANYLMLSVDMNLSLIKMYLQISQHVLKLFFAGFDQHEILILRIIHLTPWQLGQLQIFFSYRLEFEPQPFLLDHFEDFNLIIEEYKRFRRMQNS